MVRPLLVMLGAWAMACSNGGAGSDAGNDASNPSDGAPSDVAVDTSPGSDGGNNDSGATCGSYTYCEDFENYSNTTLMNGTKLGPWVATVTGSNITMQVDGANAYKSSRALHVTVPSNAGMDAGTAARGTLNQMASAGLVTGNNMYGRAMVFYSNTGSNDVPFNVHSWLFNSSGTSQAADGGVTMNMGSGGGKDDAGGVRMQLNYHPPAPLTEQSVQGGNITAGTWHCVQWEYDGSGTGASVADVGKVWVDGVLSVNVPKAQGWNFATPWDSFDFGFTHYQSLANPVDVYLDDFALDGAMVPCPP